MKKLLCCILIIALLLSPYAFANDYSSISDSDILRRGDHGSSVRKLQQTLSGMGYYSSSVDGSYGAQTESAIWEFQRKNGITPNGVATLFTQAKLYGYDALYAWNNTHVPNNSSGEYWVSNSNGYTSGSNVTVTFDFVNRDSKPVEAICIYYWLSDRKNYLLKSDRTNYWFQWYYGMSIPFGQKKSTSITLPISSKAWKKLDAVHCIVGEIAYTDGTVVVTMNAAKEPYENRNYRLMQF